MIPVVVAVQAIEGYELRLEFDDGTQGRVDVSELVAFDGVFEPLRDLSVFRQVRVDADLGTVAWPGGADLDPLVLYAKVKGIDVADLLAESPAKS
jgi:hypothetical protein